MPRAEIPRFTRNKLRNPHDEWSGTSANPTIGIINNQQMKKILNTKYEMLNNIKAQNMNDQNSLEI